MADGIMGRTHFAGLFELIQVCGIHRRDVALSFTQEGSTATILLKDGELVDAECDDLRGDEAIYEIFSWVDSYFQLTQLNSDVERTILDSNTDILMKAAEKTKDIDVPPFGPGDRIVGPLHILSSMELLQLFEINCRNARLRLKNSGDIGCIYLREGRAVHATLGETEGEQAVLDMLTWPVGDFLVESCDDAVAETIFNSISGLVMEGSLRIDLMALMDGEEEKTWQEVADQTVKQLEEANLNPADRIALAMSYQAPGTSLSVADLLQQVDHPDEAVRRDALETIDGLPPAVLQAILEDENTPNAVRYRISPGTAV